MLQSSEIEAYALITKTDVLLANRSYAKAIEHWANDTKGYIEQKFDDRG